MDVMSPLEMEGGALPGGISSRCTYAAVLCCICGCRMSSPSPQSTCLACLAQQTDITEGISRSVVLPCCVTCGRYMHTPNRWLSCELESRELMALMLPKIRGLKKVAKVIDSNWIWREPHSRRVSLKLTVQKEILNGRASVQQALVVEGIIQNTQCDNCKKSYTPHAGWTAMVQVRQHADHKRTLLFLEQLVLKHQLASRLLNVIEKPDGLDFCFPSRQLALQFSAFCESRFPCLTKQSKQLISHDASSNTHFHKYTISVTLAPLCRDDLVYVHRKQAQTHLGGFPSFALCSRVAGAGMQLLDPFTGHTTHVSVEKYWYAPFQLLCTRKHLSSFLVLDVTPVEAPGSRGCGQAGAVSQQRQQHAHAAGGGQSRRRRRRHQMLEDGGGLAVETDDDDWEKQHFNGKNRRDGKAAAMRRKRQLSGGGGGGGMLSTEHRGSVCNGTYPAPASASVNGVSAAAYSVSVPDGIRDEMATAEPMETDKIKNTQPQQLAGRAKGVTGRTPQETRGLQLCEVELMRGCDVGVCDRKVVTRTHLGGALQPGDWVQGYDLRSINLAGAVDCQLDEDVRAHAGGSSKQQSRRTRKRAGGAAARSHAGGRKEESSDSGEDMEVDGVNDVCRKQGGRSRTSGTAADNSDEAAAEALLISSTAGGGMHQEEEEENSLLRCVQFEVIIVKKQPLQRLCAAADGTATDGRGGSSARTARRSGCKVRPWVLQTLEKERDAGKQGGGGGGGKRAGRRRSHLEAGSDADMEAFKEELEEDPEMRAQVNLWKDPRYQPDGKTGNKNAVQRSKGKAKRGKDSRRSERCDGFSAGGEGGERGTEESDRRGVSSAGKGENERESGEAEAWEDYDSDLESSLEEDETAGVKLAELLEGLTLEDGKLKGLVVQPGGAQAISEGDFATAKQPTLPDAAGDEEDSEAGEL